MRLIFQECSVIFTLVNLVGALSQSFGQKDAINTTIINFNNEKMQITWATSKLFSGKNVSFYYTFEEGKQKSWKTCPTYLLTQGYNTGCLFKTDGYTLAFSIMNTNGSEELFSKRLKSDFYIKPNRPENVTFFWKDDTVTVTCNKPEKGVKCLRLELQYKSKYDKGWQSRTSKCCRVGEQGFDPRKCYSFRVRLKRIVPSCNVVDYSSDWEAETFWMNSTLLDFKNLSCLLYQIQNMYLLISSTIIMETSSSLVVAQPCSLSQSRLAVTHANQATKKQLKQTAGKRPVQLPTVRRRVRGTFNIFRFCFFKVVTFFKGTSPPDVTACS
uniref:Cytokine receptor-like factor 2 n=1 Tax=Gallus gallus TaxID=9031 RepID=A0A8V0X3V6_CHICK